MAGTPEAYVLSHRAGWGTEFQGSRPYDQGKLFQGTQEHALVGPRVRWQPAPSHPLLQAPVALPPRLATTPLPDPIASQASATSSPWGPVTWASACRTQRCPLRPRRVPTPAPLHPQSLAGPTALSAAAPPLQTLLPGLRDPFKLQVWFGDPHNPP